ncbi:VOC family protein [Poseidonibacter ostreae]|jgi:lactoylglutathione lyase|uniref:VOC family protein n=1 Tax=Poseidonibacter ostreae TaxID=2654171 RepID=A0A6L4WUQ3_9BACT|nr:VOC family protein [Poseidonibacter ostreae]KAB7885500.1 VOC family protein [Poseidonibacter ostreae]KAB7888521.1 VOC family protein [Poseidonibacter ostreae]KAB7890712.1 VOC family protein [Poseidonibacter ostreae]MAC84271.1 glyoxalase [Arcobacter sp.]|tara:strand:+ start:218 stop:655 length:438 start_codon:yes stop_codon:yes gene_type:complete
MKIGHIGINVNNMEESKEFYLKLFGFDILFEEILEDKKYIFLGKDKEIIVTLWEQSDKKFSTSTAGLHHLAFIVNCVDELKAFEKKLEEYKITKIYNGIVTHCEGSSSGGVFFLDPNGIRLEVCIAEGINEKNQSNHKHSSCGFF